MSEMVMPSPAAVGSTPASDGVRPAMQDRTSVVSSSPHVRSLVSLAARAAVAGLLGALAMMLVVAGAARRLLGAARSARSPARRRLLMVGTFYNPGWFRSHVLPLSVCPELGEVLVVCDEPLFEVPRVRYLCPPDWLVRRVGRTVARALWIVYIVRRERPDILMGYHIMPNALLCLVVARMLGGEAIYQMTGGPVQLVGGGTGSENALLRLQVKPSRLREMLMFHLVRQFDCVVVRGRRAVDFVHRHRLARKCAVVPGSVDCVCFAPEVAGRRFDLITVGRLVAVKRVDRLLLIAAELVRLRPDVRIAVVGDGPLSGRLREMADGLGLRSHVEFLGKCSHVSDLLRQSRVFILTSENEGLSIAVMEAMAAGLPALAPSIGDMPELLVDGQTGRVIDPEDAGAAARIACDVLDDAEGLARMSENARRLVNRRNDVAAVARLWSRVFGDAERVPRSELIV